MATPTSSGQASSVTLTGNRNIDSLLGGIKWGGATGQGVTLEYSFANSSSTWSTSTSGGYGPAVTGTDDPWTGYGFLSSAQAAAARAALQQWSNVANIRFTEVTETSSTVGDIRFAITSHVSGRAEVAHAYFPGSAPASGDIWLQRNEASNQQVSPGQYGFRTLLHEIGHALGLKHPFETTSNSFSLMPSQYDSADFTVMSYNLSEGKPNSSWSSSYYSTTIGWYDIAAIQYIYGANMSYRTGNDVYTYTQGQNYSETIWDAGGTDTIVWNATTQGARIDLSSGSWSTLGNPLTLRSGTQTFTQADTVLVYNGVVIENATGGGAADTLIGNAAANTLDGGGGADTLRGAAGNDTYVVDNTGDTVTESANEGTDLVRSFVSYTLPANVENLTLVGTAANATGNSLANVLSGNASANFLDAGAGNDTLHGGDGVDTAYFTGVIGSYSLSTRGSYVIVSGPDGTDIMDGIENVRFGSGTPVAVSSLGLAPSTVPLISVTRDGSTNLEVATPFSGTPIAGVRIDYQFLGDTSGEVAVGTDANDFFNLLGGDDAADGGAGDDILDGGIGSNFLTGNAGRETFFLDGRSGSITWSTITDWQAGDQLSVWGWKANSKILLWRQDGASGYQGITMHADLNDDGTIDTSVTWTGKTQAQLPTPGQFPAQELLWFT